jgi:cytochrome c oxidase subunit I
VPSAVKTFNWTATMYKGSITWESPTYWVIGFMGLFLIGGLTGLFLGTMGLDVHLHDTYFVVAHFHYIMVGGAIMAFLGGIHFYWPKMTGRMYPETLGKISAVLVFVGFNLTFFPQFVLGYLGMPRRYHAYPEEFQILNVLSTAGAGVLGAGYALIVFYLIRSLYQERNAPDNPWGATGLEWTIQSPPITANFETDPIVTEDAYNYAGRAKAGKGGEV